MRKKLLVLFSVLIIGAMLLSSCGSGTAAEVKAPVTLHWNYGVEPPTLDPALAIDQASVDVIRNMFVGLTQFNPDTGDVEPYLATEWVQGEDADGNQTWTFTLRKDTAWVHYDPITGETTQEVDADGKTRFVNAYDVVFGTKRTVDPETASDYAYITYIIKNAAAINAGEKELTLDDLGVVAVDEWTVMFTLENPAGYFPAIAGLWVMNPLPAWTIDEFGEKWTEAGNIVTNGPYVLDTWIHSDELTLVKNLLWINVDDVQIERVQGYMIVEDSTAFAMYENSDLDTHDVPLPEMDRVQADPVLSEEYFNAPRACTYYYGFTNNKPPFDDVRVRTAFTQAIDRQSLIDNVLKGGQIPATSFAPPGIFGAPELGTVGLPSDPAAAKAAFQDYLDDKGMTVDDFDALGVTLMHNTSEGHASIAAAIQQMWAETLGVEVQVENQEWAVYLVTIQNDSPLDDMPHIWRSGWCSDYPDENNWVHEVFNADVGANQLRRESDKFDELTTAAGKSQDPADRAALYFQAEEELAFIEVAYAPIYHYSYVNVTKPWLVRNFPPLGGNDFFNWTLDMGAKLAAQGK
jgi:oligopeptide transport system substrate-binding protein